MSIQEYFLTADLAGDAFTDQENIDHHQNIHTLQDHVSPLQFTAVWLFSSVYTMPLVFLSKHSSSHVWLPAYKINWLLNEHILSALTQEPCRNRMQTRWTHIISTHRDTDVHKSASSPHPILCQALAPVRSIRVYVCVLVHAERENLCLVVNVWAGEYEHIL